MFIYASKLTMFKKIIGFLILAILLGGSTTLASTYSPTPEDTKQLEQLSKVVNYMYNQDPSKVEKLQQGVTKAKAQFSDDPRLYFIFGQLEIFISNILAYEPTPSYTAEEVKVHQTKLTCRIIIDQEVYDITPFLKKYPSFSSLEDRCGQNKTAYFNNGSAEAKQIKEAIQKYIIGDIKN